MRYGGSGVIFWGLADQLAALRGDVDRLAHEVNRVETELSSDLALADSERLDLSARVRDEELRLERAQREIERIQQSVAEPSSEALTLVLNEALASLRVKISTGLPYRQTERLEALDPKARRPDREVQRARHLPLGSPAAALGQSPTMEANTPHQRDFHGGSPRRDVQDGSTKIPSLAPWSQIPWHPLRRPSHSPQRPESSVVLVLGFSHCQTSAFQPDRLNHLCPPDVRHLFFWRSGLGETHED